LTAAGIDPAEAEVETAYSDQVAERTAAALARLAPWKRGRGQKASGV
jgi:hypothetical protein